MSSSETPKRNFILYENEDLDAFHETFNMIANTHRKIIGELEVLRKGTRSKKNIAAHTNLIEFHANLAGYFERLAQINTIRDDRNRDSSDSGCCGDGCCEG